MVVQWVNLARPRTFSLRDLGAYAEAILFSILVAFATNATKFFDLLHLVGL